MPAKTTVRLEGLEGVLDTLKELGPAASARGGPVRAALRKAAMIVVAQAKLNVRAIVTEPNIGGRASKSRGLLEKSIIAKRGRAVAGQKGESFVVTVKRGARRKYTSNRANVRSGRAGKTYEESPPAFYGWFLEYGTARMRPHPWIRPAYESTKQKSLNVFVQELPRAIVALQKKLARQNGVKA